MQDGVLVVAGGVLRLAKWVNWAAAGMLLAALLLSFAFGQALTSHLAAKYPDVSPAATILVMRGMAAIGIAAAVAVHQIVTRLLAVLATVRAGDPFVAANAERLQRIGWALLAIQLLDLAVGLIVLALDRLGVDHATWTPAFTGWIAVVMIFVLARVFRAGAAMRDDLALTV